MTASSNRSRAAQFWAFLALSPAALGACSNYSRTEVLRYLPTDCSEGQFYVDVSALTSLDAIKAKFKAPEQALGSMTDKSADAKAKVNDIIDTFKSTQFNPLTDLKDIAACATKANEVYVAFGGNFGGSGTLDKAKKLTEGLSKSAGYPITWTTHEQDGMRSLEAVGVWLYSPAKNVLILGAFGADRKDVSKRHELPSSWQVGAATWISAGASDSRVDIAKDGSNLQLTGEIGSQVLDVFSVDLKTQRDAAVAYLKGSPLSALAEPLSQFEFSKKGSNTVIKGKIPVASVNSIVSSALESPTDFAKSFQPKPVDKTQCKLWMSHIEHLFEADLDAAIDSTCKKPASRKKVKEQLKSGMSGMKDSFATECDSMAGSIDAGAGVCIMAAQSLEELKKCNLGADVEAITSGVGALHDGAKTLCDAFDSMP